MKLALYQHVFKQAPIGLLLLDSSQRILAWNQWLEDRTGYKEEEVCGKRLVDVYPNLKNERFDWALNEAITNQSQQILTHTLNHHLIPIEVTYAGQHGLKYMPQTVSIAPVKNENEVIAMVSIQDVTENVIRSKTLTKVAHALEKESLQDQLTGAYNRRFLWQWLDQEMKSANRYHYSISCLILDLDFFKRINDSLGHQVGDKVLQGFVSLVASQLRESDVLVRYGGEEFIIMLSHVDSTIALKMAERIRQLVQDSSIADLDAGKVTCSVGVSFWDYQTNDTTDKLLHQADEALYKAKLSGRNCVKVYDGEKTS